MRALARSHMHRLREAHQSPRSPFSLTTGASNGSTDSRAAAEPPPGQRRARASTSDLPPTSPPQATPMPGRSEVCVWTHRPPKVFVDIDDTLFARWSDKSFPVSALSATAAVRVAHITLTQSSRAVSSS